MLSSVRNKCTKEVVLRRKMKNLVERLMQRLKDVGPFVGQQTASNLTGEEGSGQLCVSYR